MPVATHKTPFVNTERCFVGFSVVFANKDQGTSSIHKNGKQPAPLIWKRSKGHLHQYRI